MFAYKFAKALKRPGIPQGFITMSSGQGGGNRQLASPLSWTSFRGVKDLDTRPFRARLNELFLQYPNSAVARKAAAQHIAEVKKFARGIRESDRQGLDPATFALQAPETAVALRNALHRRQRQAAQGISGGVAEVRKAMADGAWEQLLQRSGASEAEARSLYDVYSS